MTLFYCRSAGQARACASCKHSPLNQIGKPKGREISPVVRDAKCPQYVMAVDYGVRKNP